MPKVERTEIFDVDIDSFYKVITDYESYPTFVDGVSEIVVVKKTKTKAEVEFIINLIKKFSYSLDIKQKEGTGISWTLIKGDIFKKNTGGWVLKDMKEKGTKVTYQLEVEFKGFAPQVVVNKLVANNLPAMMKAYYKKAKALKKGNDV